MKMKHKLMYGLLASCFILGLFAINSVWATRATTPDGFTHVTGLSVDQGIQLPVTAKTADYSLETTEAMTVFTNTGASITITFQLPEASNVLGRPFYFATRQVGLAMNVEPNYTDNIRYFGLSLHAGDKIAATADGQFVGLVAVDASTYLPVGATGTWNDGGI